MWVKVRVTDAAGNPVTDATVTIIEPSVTSPTLTHLSNGVYGAGGTCYSSATSSNTTVRVRAERAFYTTAEVSDDTDNQPASDSCP